MSRSDGPEQKTLVIHSGTFKTGSTAIQLYLDRAQRAGLLESAGFTYPTVGRTTGVQHANLVAAVRGEGVFMRRHGGWERLLEEMQTSGSHTTVVSAEALSTFGPEELRQIGHQCSQAGVKVRWVQYVRDQPSLYNAFYVERVITMRPDMMDVINLPYSDFGTWSPTNLSFLKFATFADHVLEAIPGVDLVLRPFVREHMVDGDSVADFCATIGAPFEPAHGGKANVGAGWRTVETARRLVPLINDAKLGQRVKEAPNRRAARQRWLQHIRGELITASSSVGWNKETASYMTPEVWERLLGEYNDENVRLSEIADFNWLEMVESRRMKPYNVGDYSDVSGEEMIVVLSRVLSMVHQMPPEIEAMVEKGRANRAAKAAKAANTSPPPVSFARRTVRAARRRFNR